MTHMLNHKTRTIWGKVCNCRVCFQLNRPFWGEANTGQHHHSSVPNVWMIMSHNPGIPSLFSVVCPWSSQGYVPWEIADGDGDFPCARNPNRQWKIQGKAHNSLQGWPLEYPSQKLDHDYFISFLLPNNLHMNFHHPKNEHLLDLI